MLGDGSCQRCYLKPYLLATATSSSTVLLSIFSLRIASFLPVSTRKALICSAEFGGSGVSCMFCQADKRSWSKFKQDHYSCSMECNLCLIKIRSVTTNKIVAFLSFSFNAMRSTCWEQDQSRVRTSGSDQQNFRLRFWFVVVSGIEGGCGAFETNSPHHQWWCNRISRWSLCKNQCNPPNRLCISQLVALIVLLQFYQPLCQWVVPSRRRCYWWAYHRLFYHKFCRYLH